MKYKPWPKCDPVKNYFQLPNEIFLLGLSPGALAVYSYLLCCENRSTYFLPLIRRIYHSSGAGSLCLRVPFTAFLSAKRLPFAHSIPACSMPRILMRQLITASKQQKMQ